MAQVVDRRWKRGPGGERVRSSYDGPTPWLARWRDPDGNQRMKGFARKVDAEQHLVSIEHRKLVGEYVDPTAGRVTVREYLEAWRARQVHRPSTREQIESNFRKHVYPRLGDRQLRSLRPSDVQEWVTDRSQHLAPGTVELIYRHLASALRDAEHDRLIGRTPCQRIRLPRKVATEVVPPTVDQVVAITGAMAERYRAAVTVAAGAGLRLGEVLGLQVDRVDFLRRQLVVDQQLLTPNRGPAVLGPPKTEASRRTVPLPEVVTHALGRHLEEFPAVDGFIFTTELDNPVRRSTFQDAWKRATTRADAGGVRFHDLRHFYASALISSGCTVKQVQKALGHASATETLETYAHLWPDDEDRTRQAIQSVLGDASARCARNVRDTASVAEVE